MSAVKNILEYWFGDSQDDLQVLENRSKLWFSKDPQVDREITTRFQDLVECASRNGLLPGYEPIAQRYLATLVLLDQFPRNIYRGSARSFAYDEKALTLAKVALAAGYDQPLRPIERVFIYLPLEHCEDRGMQERCVALFTQLLEDVPENHHSAFAGFHDYAVRHQEIIARFGRFPHRNQLLGRESTGEELAFLQQPNSSF